MPNNNGGSGNSGGCSKQKIPRNYSSWGGKASMRSKRFNEGVLGVAKKEKSGSSFKGVQTQ